MEKRIFLEITDLPDQHCLQEDLNLFVSYPIPEEEKRVHNQTQPFVLPNMAQFRTAGSRYLLLCVNGVSF